MSIGFRFAANSNVGVVRSGNEDAGLADSRMLAVADGMGGHAAGEVASSCVIRTLSDSISEIPLEREFASPWMVELINSAHNRVGDLVAQEPELRGMGTTLSAVVACDDGCLLAHVGDSRIYTLIDGNLTQVSTDHTYVQTLVESGEITEEQALHHPRRNLLMRAIDGVHSVDVDVLQLPLSVGDRVLLCSDGLTGVLPDAVISELSMKADLTFAVSQLIEYALAAGAPDNVTVVLAEVVSPAPESEPCLLGSAELEASVSPTEASHDRPVRSRWRILTGLAVVAAVFVAFLANSWLRSQWYLGTDGEHVVVYQGIPQNLGPIDLSSEVQSSPVLLRLLDAETQQRLERGIQSDSPEAALGTLAEIVATQDCADTGCASQ